MLHSRLQSRASLHLSRFFRVKDAYEEGLIDKLVPGYSLNRFRKMRHEILGDKETFFDHVRGVACCVRFRCIALRDAKANRAPTQSGECIYDHKRQTAWLQGMEAVQQRPERKHFTSQVQDWPGCNFEALPLVQANHALSREPLAHVRI